MILGYFDNSVAFEGLEHGSVNSIPHAALQNKMYCFNDFLTRNLSMSNRSYGQVNIIGMMPVQNYRGL